MEKSVTLWKSQDPDPDFSFIKFEPKTQELKSFALRQYEKTFLYVPRPTVTLTSGLLQNYFY